MRDWFGRLFRFLNPSSKITIYEDLVTDTYRLLHAKWLLGGDAQDAPGDYSDPAIPDYVAVGTGQWELGSGAKVKTALKAEMARVQVQTKQVKDLGLTARLTAVFPPGTATMAWHEIGLFNAPEIATTISECDSEGTAPAWTYGDNSGSLELVAYRQGSACLEAVGTAPSPRFVNSILDVTPNITTAGYFQLYYYVDAITHLAGNLEIKIGNDSSNYWQFNTAHGDIEAGWQWLSFKVSERSSETGSPDIGQTINYFYLGYSAPLGGSLLDRIDFIRMFEENGDMYTRHEMVASNTKGVNEAKHVIAKLQIKGG